MMKYEQEFYENVKKVVKDINDIKKHLEKAFPTKENCFVEIFVESFNEGESSNILDMINDFLQDKVLVDIKMSESGMSGCGNNRTYLVIYKDIDED